MNSIYEKEEINELYKSWNMFSVLHSTPNEGFQFIVYNSSHLIEDNQTIHRKSKVILNFPKNSSYYVVFHGRLVHSGGKSLGCINGKAIRSPRLFSYLKVPIHNTSMCSKKTNSLRLRGYTNKLHQGTIDRGSLSMCQPNCQKCGHLSTQVDTIVSLPINKKGVSSLQQQSIIPVIGNMAIDGWEVYNGIDFIAMNNEKFSSDLNELLVTSNKKFNGISSTNRKIIVLSSLDSMIDKNIRHLKKLQLAFHELLSKNLRKIHYLQEVQLDSLSIIANFGEVQEQEPHRDFKSIKHNNLKH